METKPQRVVVDISWEALLRVLALAVGIWAVFLLREILIMLFVVFIFVAAATPTINRLGKHMSRPLAVTLFYVLMLAVVVGIFSALVPQLVHQINELVKSLPFIIDKVRAFSQNVHEGSAAAKVLDQVSSGLTSTLDTFSSGLLDTTITFFSNLAVVVTALAIGFYLLLEEKNARDFFNQLLPQHRYEAVYITVSKIAERMGGWVRGQLLLMVLIGLADLIIYAVIGLPSPLPLAIWAGLCEVIPYVGPILGVLPALIVALTTGSILQAVLVFGLGFILVQQLEAHVVVPRVMGRAVGLSPVLVILAILAGGKLFGLFGALIAIPAAAIVSVVVHEWPQLRKIWE